jgi:hypothetical protein
MQDMDIDIDVMPGTYAVCRLARSAAIPTWATIGAFVSITRTSDELSIICASAAVPHDTVASHDWRTFKLRGPFDMDLVGVMLSVAAPLAAAGVSIMPISTYDTDYVLVRDQQFTLAVASLRRAGHVVHSPE